MSRAAPTNLVVNLNRFLEVPRRFLQLERILSSITGFFSMMLSGSLFTE